MARRIPLKTIGADLQSIVDRVNAEEIGPDEANAEAEAALARDGVRIDYRATLIHKLENPAAGAWFETADVGRRAKLAALLRAAEGDSVVVEEADYNQIKVAIDTARWPDASANRAAFLDDIRNAETVKLS